MFFIFQPVSRQPFEVCGLLQWLYCQVKYIYIDILKAKNNLQIFLNITFNTNKKWFFTPKICGRYVVVLPWAPVEVLAFMLQSIHVQAAHYSHLSYCMYVGTYRDCVMGLWSSICREFNYLHVSASCHFKDSFL